MLNTDALLRSGDPFGNASRTAIEEINVHKGISSLFGSRQGQRYIDAMDGLQRNFDRNKLNDRLAQVKGYANMEDMANAYGYSDHATNRAHQHALTEELAGAYGQQFGNRLQLEQHAPRWWQNGMRMLSDGIRQRFGMQVEPLDMQGLLADSNAALRFPKYGEPGQFDPELVRSAQRDMADNQMAALVRQPREEQPELPGFQRAAELPIAERVAQQNIERLGAAPEPQGAARLAADVQARQAAGAPTPAANIGDQFVKHELGLTRAQMGPGQGLREGAVRKANESWRDFSERMGLASYPTAVYDIRSDEMVQRNARELFDNVYGGDVHRAMEELLKPTAPGDTHPALQNITNRETAAKIRDYEARGLNEAANALRLERDKFNQQIERRGTELGQEFRQRQKLYQDGAMAIGSMRNRWSTQQQRKLGRDAKVSGAYNAILDASKQAAASLVNRVAKMVPAVGEFEAKRAADPRSLAQRYIESVADAVNSQMAKAGMGDADRPMLQNLFNTFQQNIREQIGERTSLPEDLREKTKPSSTQNIRDVISNTDMFERTWRETVDRLKNDNPNSLFFSKLDEALAQPFGEAGVRKVIGEGNKISDLIYNHYSTQDRVGNDLARSLTENTGISPDQATRIQNHFDRLFKDILQTEQAKALQQALDSAGTKGTGKPAKGEAQRLIDLMAIGGFDKEEHYNLLAPRFGMGAWDQRLVDGMKQAGDEIQRIRDNGLGQSKAVMSRWQNQLSDLIAMTNPQAERSWRYLESFYMASLLTGPVSHTSYALQNATQGLINAWLHGGRMVLRNGNWQAFQQMHLDAINGFVRVWNTDAPLIMREGIVPRRGLEAEPGLGGGALPMRSALEQPVPHGGLLGAVEEAYASGIPTGTGKRIPVPGYKYIGRILATMEQFAVRGTEYSMNRVIATELADRMGYSGAEATRFADEAIYGTEEKRAQANAQALEEQTKYGLSNAQTKAREGEILDELRSVSDNPDSGIADRETQALQDMQRRSILMGLHSAYREDVPGRLGQISRQLTGAKRDIPAQTFITPFIKLPANLANEFLAWTPLGMVRGRDFVTGGTEAMEKYYGRIPGMDEKIRSGLVPADFLRDMAAEQFIKGAVGTVAAGAIGLYMDSQKNNPDAPFWVTFEGPASAAGQDAAKAEGWQRESVRLNIPGFGTRYFSYESSPLRGMFAFLGGLGDYLRYEAKPDDSFFDAGLIGSFEGAASTAKSTLGTPLQGLAAALQFASGAHGKEAMREIMQFVTQNLSALATAPIGGTGTRQLYRSFIDQREFTAGDASAKFLRNIPVVNSMFLQPKLNVLGEPVTSTPMSRLIPSAPRDDVWNYLANSGLKLSLPGNSKSLDGEKLMPDELYVYHQARGANLKSQLATAIKDPSFTSMPIADQNSAVKQMEIEAKAMGESAVYDYRQAHPRPENK